MNTEESVLPMNDDVKTVYEEEAQMKQMKRLRAPLLSGVLLMATLAGVAGARPDARPQEQAWRVLTVPPAACTPVDYLDSWYLPGDSLKSTVGDASFLCAVNFPAAGEQAVGAVNVKRVTMYAFDMSAGGDNAVELRIMYAPTGGQQLMAYAHTIVSPDDPQQVMDTTIEHNPVYRTHGPYLFVYVDNPNDRVYGVFIHYTWV
jgi:hypothetical protein